MLVFKAVVHRPSLSRRQVLQAGAVAAVAGALRPAVPAFAARPALFELDLEGALPRASAAAAGGWRTTPVLRAPRRFDLVGLRWARGSDAEAMVRARRRGGSWTEWAALHTIGDHAPDETEAGATPPGTDPAFVGAADELQLRVRGNPRGLRARFVRALPTASLAGRAARRLRGRHRAAARAAQVGTPPPIIPRSAWGGDSLPPREKPIYGEVQIAFVHHTVTTNKYGPEDSAALVLGIARFHRDGNRWNDIGYNFLVDIYGQVFEGRAGGVDQAVVGAQAQGYNSVSTGIACLGTFTDVAQSPAGMDALARLIGWKLSLHAIPTDGTVTVTSAGGSANRYPAGTPVTFERISGHRDGNSTACPGNILYAQLAELRTAAARFAGPISGLTVYATRRIRGVRPVDVSGYLRFPDGSSPAGAPLDVEYQSAGSAWSSIAQTFCHPDGSWRATVTLPASGRVRVVFAGDGLRPRQESLPRRVSVLARVSLQVSDDRLRRGQVVEVTGSAAPAERVSLTIERRSGRRWVRERRRSLAVRDGVFRMRVRPRRSAKYRVTARVGGVRRRRIMRVL
jgi:N-acetylmuramoyl-L-alanine amidase